MRIFTPLPPEEQLAPFEGIVFTQCGREIAIEHRTMNVPRMSNEDHDRVEAAVRQILKFTAPIRFQHPHLGKVSKSKLRRWLNKNMRARWRFGADEIWFEDDFDGTHYKLMWV